MFAIAPTNGQTWLICGGRDFRDRAMFDDVMRDLLYLRGCPEKMVHGGARGADDLADKWAEKMGLHCIAVPADWRQYGSAAGPIRNGEMMDKYRPDFVIAFPGAAALPTWCAGRATQAPKSPKFDRIMNRDGKSVANLSTDDGKVVGAAGLEPATR